MADSSGIARFEVTGLQSARAYRYAVAALPAPNAPPSDGDGVLREIDDGIHQFHTHPEGAADLTIAFASCARTGSNGAVFDAIRATEPDLFVQLGDLHYGNLVSTDPGDHIAVLGRSLSTPAPVSYTHLTLPTNREV